MDEVIFITINQPARPKKHINIALFVVIWLIALVSATIWAVGDLRVMNVMSNSMQDTLPKGSLIIIGKVAPKDLKIGDDITFYVDQQMYTLYTHRIVDIFDNYNNSGMGFQTKGTNNLLADDFIVNESSIVGRVIFHIPKIGGAITALGSYILNPNDTPAFVTSPAK